MQVSDAAKVNKGGLETPEPPSCQTPAPNTHINALAPEPEFHFSEKVGFLNECRDEMEQETDYVMIL